MFVNAPEVVDRSLCSIIGHAKHGKSARPGSSTAHLANLGQRQSRAKDAFDSVKARKDSNSQGSAPASFSATDLRDHSRRCQLDELWVPMW